MRLFGLPGVVAGTRAQLWLLRPLRLRVRVVEAPAQPRHVALDAVLVQVEAVPETSLADVSVSEAAEWTQGWMSDLGLGRLRVQSRLGTDGAGDVEVPWFRHLRISATAAGGVVRPQRLTPPSPLDSTGAEVVLEIHGVPSCRVKVRDPEGMAIAGARVCGMVTLRFDDAEIRWQDHHLPGAALTITGVSTRGPHYVTYHYERTVGADGDIEFPMPVHGPTLVVAHAPGFRPARVGIPASREDVLTELLLQRPTQPGCRVHLVRGRRPLSAGILTVVDVTRIEQEAPVTVEIAADGTIAAEWFEVGRDYALRAPGGGVASRFVRWDGSAQLDLDSLPDNLTEFDLAVGRTYDDLR